MRKSVEQRDLRRYTYIYLSQTETDLKWFELTAR